MSVFNGEAIREMRKLRGWTQEVLAENICATSTLSKIENGHCIPYRRTYFKLMNKLGGSGLNYDEMCVRGGYHQERLRRELIVSMENNEIDRAEDSLIELSDILDMDIPENYQLLEAAKLLIYKLRGYENGDFREKLTNILYITRSAEELMQTHPCSMHLSETELLILNNIALEYLRESNPAMALGIYRIMVPNFINRLDNGYMDISRAVLYNNIAVCLLYTGKYVMALEYCDKAITIAEKRGGLQLLYRLFYLKKKLLLCQGQKEKAITINEILEWTRRVFRTDERESVRCDESEIGLGICIL